MPSMRPVLDLLDDHTVVLAVDEVGRGAAAGPCSVGVVLCAPPLKPAPDGLADSKSLSATKRRVLVDPIKQWVPSAVGHASAREIDEWGLTTALTLAFHRALHVLPVPAPPAVLLDGSYDWVNPKPRLILPDELRGLSPLSVSTIVKGDQSCTAIAAASILAKVERDAMMIELDRDHPGYGWASNKGYLSAAHVDGLRTLGFSPQHRRSWSYGSASPAPGQV